MKRVNGLLESTFATFFPSTYGGNVLSEVACEPIMSCDRNQLGFKGYTAMWLAHTAILVPSTAERITPKLQGSAEAIAKQCSGESENLCGETWGKDTWDGMKGLEVQMAALGGITSNLMLLESKSPQTIDTNPDAAEHHIDNNENSSKDSTKAKPIETADRAGAWILTVMIAAGAIGAVGWLIKTQ